MSSWGSGAWHFRNDGASLQSFGVSGSVVIEVLRPPTADCRLPTDC